MLLKKIFMIIFFLFFLILNLFARTFSLDEAMEIAIDKNPDLKILEIELDELKNSIAQNKTEILPRINLVAQALDQDSFDSNLVYENSKIVSKLVPVEKKEYDLKITGEQKIIDLAYLSKISSLKKKYDAEYSGYLQKKQDVAFEIVNAYYSLIKSEQTKQIIEKDILILESYLKDIKNKLSLSFETKQTVLNMELTLANKKQELYKNDQIYYADKTDFSGLLEFPLSLDFEVLNFDGLYNINIDKLDLPSAKTILKNALLKRLDVNKLIKIAESLKKEKSSIKKGFLPSFSMQASYGYLDEEKFSNNDENEYWTVTFSGKFNIFNGLYEYLQIKELDKKFEKNEQELKNLRKKLEIEIDKILFYIEIQQKKYEETKKNIDISFENLNINRDLFFKKQITKDDLINFELKYNSAKLEFIEAKVDLMLSKKKYEYIIGELKS
jgi:outer membrane protein